MIESAATGHGLRWRLTRLLADERVRFLLVGAFNTAFGYAAFAALDILWGRTIGYLGSLYGAYLIATVIAFMLHRGFTFRATGTGKILIDFLRFQGVYLVSLAINSVALPALVGLAHWPPLLAQALIVVVTTLVSFFGHKYFSFRRKAETATPPDSEAGQ